MVCLFTAKNHLQITGKVLQNIVRDTMIKCYRIEIALKQIQKMNTLRMTAFVTRIKCDYIGWLERR